MEEIDAEKLSLERYPEKIISGWGSFPKRDINTEKRNVFNNDLIWLIKRLKQQSGLDLIKLEKKLDESLDKETPESLNKWLKDKREEELTKQDLIDLQESYAESKAIERRALTNNVMTPKALRDSISSISYDLNHGHLSHDEALFKLKEVLADGNEEQ